MSVKSYPNKRDCEHGQLRRSCPICAADADYAALRARHNALVEAVAWERECDGMLWPIYGADEYFEVYNTNVAARAEVDRLLQEPPC